MMLPTDLLTPVLTEVGRVFQLTVASSQEARLTRQGIVTEPVEGRVYTAK